MHLVALRPIVALQRSYLLAYPVFVFILVLATFRVDRFKDRFLFAASRSSVSSAASIRTSTLRQSDAMTKPPSLLDFLQTSKQAFLECLDKKDGASLSEWTIAVGNEAGDLDSLVSAIAFAYFSHIITPSNSLFVPLILTAHSDLYLRPENQLAIDEAKIPSSSLLCIDDLTSTEELGSLGIKFALVDHNVLLPIFRPTSSSESFDSTPSSWDSLVTSIIDHHSDEAQHLSAKPRLIEVTGSCTSLVLSHFSPLLPPEYAVSVPLPLADLLLSTIAIDTSLKPLTNGGKATPKDLATVEYLLPLSSFKSGSSAPSAVLGPSMTSLIARHQLLMKKKFDVGDLNGRDLLRRDYKEYDEHGFSYGLSTVPLGLKTWLIKQDNEGNKGWESIKNDLEKWISERKLDFAGILTTFTSNSEDEVDGKGKHRRELVIHVAKAKEAELKSLFEGLEKDQTLKLEPWKGGKADELQGSERWKVWSQGNAKATRKQVAPAVKALIAHL